MIKFFTYLESLGNQLLIVYVSWFISLTIFIIPGEKFPLTVFFYSFLWVSLSNRWNMLCGGRNCELRTHNCEGRKILLGVKPVSDLKNSTEVSSNALENIKWFKWCGAAPWLWKFLHLLSEEGTQSHGEKWKLRWQNEPNAGRNYIGTTLLELLRSCIKLKFIYLYVTAEAVKTFL